MSGLIDLYLYSIDSGKLRFLLFHRAKGKIYQNQWRMIGGKQEESETHWQAALRELKEETGLTPNRFWTIPSLNHFYEPKTDQIRLIPAFAAEISMSSEILLDDEHSQYRWIEVDQISEYIQWPEQQRLLELVSAIVQRNEILPEWQILF